MVCFTHHGTTFMTPTYKSNSEWIINQHPSQIFIYIYIYCSKKTKKKVAFVSYCTKIVLVQWVQGENPKKDGEAYRNVIVKASGCNRLPMGTWGRGPARKGIFFFLYLSSIFYIHACYSRGALFIHWAYRMFSRLWN
jgi:hypothetical protein